MCFFVNTACVFAILGTFEYSFQTIILCLPLVFSRSDKRKRKKQILSVQVFRTGNKGSSRDKKINKNSTKKRNKTKTLTPFLLTCSSFLYECLKTNQFPDKKKWFSSFSALTVDFGMHSRDYNLFLLRIKKW